MQQEKIFKAQVYSNLEKPVRWNGIIDYKTLITVAVYIFLIWNVTSIFAVSMFTRLYIVLILTVPFIVFIKSYINEADIIFILIIILRFCFTAHLYVYDIFDDIFFFYDYEHNVIEHKVGKRKYKIKYRQHKK